MSRKYVYYFGPGGSEGDKSMKEHLGGKGANLAEMANLGIPVPPGFTLVTDVCDYYYKNEKQYPPELEQQVKENLEKVEKATGKKFGDPSNPLLVSVRSGAAVSMPGMMDTVLNLGINDEVVEGLIKKTGNERFAWDSYRRFLQMFGDVALELPHEKFEEILEKQKEKSGAKKDTDLTVEDLKEVVAGYKNLYKEILGREFPTDPMEQLWISIGAVVKSWMNDRAIKYRQINDIKGLLGTAVNVQTMVFGNMGESSATGVCFTRNPSTGEKQFYGEFLINAQGEDVVAGIRTPQEITKEGSIEWAKSNNIPEDVRAKEYPSLEEAMPELYKELVELKDKLEQHYRDMQDIEFTIEEGKMYILQTRNGKRTAKAAIKIAVDMVHEGLINKKEAVLRVSPNDLDQLLHPMIDPVSEKDHTPIGKGLPASPGAAVGQVVFTAADAERWVEEGKKVVLVRLETSPEDIGGMDVAEGILTARGGMTSHAAVVARGMGKCCVAGLGEINFDADGKGFTLGGVHIKEGDFITLNGTSGNVYQGQLKLIQPELKGDLDEFMSWVDEFRKIGVRTNADTPKDSKVARSYGAEGIGLCRTEHMFFEGNRIDYVRGMILSKDEEGRKKPLVELKKMQKEDFVGIFDAMEGLPVTVRLLDPPLHEFLPQANDAAEIKKLAEMFNMDAAEIKKTIEDLHEFNPMLGHRGCRLGITFPDIYDMQVEAIIEAAVDLTKAGKKVYPEIMIPLVGHKKELDFLERRVRNIADNIIKEAGVELKYMVGTMIEVPRAAITADQIAETAEFFSFGTNDLTQMGCGFSRDDAGKFLKHYVDMGIYEYDPFQVLDQEGIGELVKIGVEKGRKTRPELKVGICGEHGGEPRSVEFCYQIGMNYVSCSPYRVPIARLAAAQAALRDEN
ncbi:MAG: pyruvate, phosphate dikinase [Calditrichia bacterium]